MCVVCVAYFSRTITSAVALWDYTARSVSEISFKEGDTVLVEEMVSGEWYVYLNPSLELILLLY